MSATAKFTYFIAFICICLNISCENATANVKPKNASIPNEKVIPAGRYVDIIPRSQLKRHDEHHLDSATKSKFQALIK